MSAPPSKEVRAHLLAAKAALASGDAARARASCRSALALDDTSYDAWVFDGKAAFACGDAESALASYRVAAGVRDDHPAAWRARSKPPKPSTTSPSPPTRWRSF